MNKKITTKQIVGTGLLLALEIIFQIIGNYIHIGTVNINLTLSVVALAAVFYGPFSGAVVGFFNGLMALLSPDTMAFFMPYSVIGTVLACLLKTTLAGLIVGFVFKVFKQRNQIIGLLIVGLLVPIINTGIFMLACLIFFRTLLESNVNELYPNIWALLIFGFIGLNFIFEIISTPVLTISLGTPIIKREQGQ